MWKTEIWITIFINSLWHREWNTTTDMHTSKKSHTSTSVLLSSGPKNKWPDSTCLSSYKIWTCNNIHKHCHCFCKLTIRQQISFYPPPSNWHTFFHNTYKFHTFWLGWEIANSHRLTDSAVSFRKPFTTGKHPDALCGT